MEACRENRGPLFKYDGQRADVEICKGCRFYRSNIELAPEPLSQPIAVAFELNELFRGGARFDYPNGLSPFEWASLNGLTRGNTRAEKLKAERERKRPKPKPTNG